MESCTQYRPPVVEKVDAAAWAAHPRFCPELISIRLGQGTCLVNGRTCRYGPGSLLLVSPTDTCRLTSPHPTQLGVVRFDEAYRGDLAECCAGVLPLGSDEQNRLNVLLALLFAAPPLAPPFADALTDSLLRAVLSLLGPRLVACPAAASAAAPSYAAAFVQRVLAHIHRHITEPGRLRLEQLAADFAYSPKHLSALFKRETGEALHRYIVRYKLQLVEARLLRSTHTVSQIADELAFTDVSHLNKQFKKQYHATPSGYRRHLTTSPFVRS